MSIELYVEDGPLSGRSFGFAPDRATALVGRSDEQLRVDVDLGVYGGMVSRRHLNVRPAPDGLWVTDLGSRNGTLLDGEDLEPYSERFAPIGAHLQLAPPDGPNLLVWQRSQSWGGDVDAIERAQRELVELRAAYTALQQENQRLVQQNSGPSAAASDWEQYVRMVAECQDELNTLRLSLLDQGVASAVHGLLSKVSTRLGDLKGSLLGGRRY